MKYALTGLLIGLFLMIGSVALGTEEPITANMEITPTALTGPGSIRVAINIMNTSDDGQSISVTLLDPDGNVCSSFGSGGTANLGPSQAKPYNGTWMVTQAQLDNRRVSYTIRYTYTDESGMKTTTSSIVSRTITHNKAAAKLHIERMIDPPKAQQGQTITISYAIKNIGTVDLLNITFTDPAIISDPYVHPSLAVGETATVSYSFETGSSSVETNATATYEYMVNDKVEKGDPIEAGGPATIDVTVPDLLVQLTGQQIVNKGDKVDLTYVITNKTDLSYEQVKLTDVLLGDIDSNLSIKPQQTYTNTYSITVNEDATYQFTLTAVDSTGANAIFLSNQLSIQTTQPQTDTVTAEHVPVVLSIVAEADRPVIYVEPGEVTFRIKVTNNGAAAVENVAVRAAGPGGTAGTTIRTIDRLEPGQTYDFVRLLSVSIGGQFKFTASSKDSAGQESTAESNVITIPYEFIPTLPPPPTPTPGPTETPEPLPDGTVSPGWGDGESADSGPGLGTILLYVLAGLFGFVILAVVVLFFLDGRRRSGGQAKVIDSIQRTPQRDYTRAARQGAAGEKQPSAKRGKAPATQDEPPVPEESAPDAGMEEPPLASAANPVAEEDKAPEITIERTPIDPMSIYQRPSRRQDQAVEAAPPAAESALPAEAEEASSQEDAEPAPLEDTAVFHRRDYLSRIRGNTPEAPSPKEKASPFDDPSIAPPSGTERRRSAQEEEDAALLSGSTGQYRLSRRSGSVRSRDTEAPAAAPPRRKVEDPEAYNRRQRATRAAKTDLANFYDDDDDEPPTTPKRRR